MPFYAHSAPTGRDSDFEPLRDHLRAVADRAAAFGAVFGAGEEARFTGLLHDLGKYSEIFQARLRGEASGLDHWSPGAYAACKATQRSLAAILSILGHHMGLLYRKVGTRLHFDLAHRNCPQYANVTTLKEMLRKRLEEVTNKPKKS